MNMFINGLSAGGYIVGVDVILVVVGVADH